MARFPRILPRLRPKGPSLTTMVKPRSWSRRHWIPIAIAVFVLVAGLVATAWAVLRPAAACGRGLAAAGQPQVCVGLDLETQGFGTGDELLVLRQKLARLNSAVSGDYATIVLLDNMTPNPAAGSDELASLRNRIAGAMTAVWRANNESVASGTTPKIRLLLANYGSSALSWQQAVNAIKQARETEHIVAVAGIGQSLDRTRAAIAALSEAQIAVVGSVITADNMNTDLNGRHIQNFVRVAPLNSDEAKAGLSFITAHGYQKVMLVQDENQSDSYAQTLRSAFAATYEATRHTKIGYTERFRSPEESLRSTNRDDYMTGQFAKMHGDICAIQPDLVYFAGRGTDLRSFLGALTQGGACGLAPLDIVTGDDASNIVGVALPAGGPTAVHVFYTSLANGGQWAAEQPNSINRLNYEKFANAYAGNGFQPSDLSDGQAIMSHDAVLTAATAVRDDRQAITDPSTVAAYFLGYRCSRFIPGAGGAIAFDANGNPIDKVLPILRIEPDGSVTQQELAWPLGAPLEPTKDTCT